MTPIIQFILKLGVFFVLPTVMFSSSRYFSLVNDFDLTSIQVATSCPLFVPENLSLKGFCLNFKLTFHLIFNSLGQVVGVPSVFQDPRPDNASSSMSKLLEEKCSRNCRYQKRPT